MEIAISRSIFGLKPTLITPPLILYAQTQNEITYIHTYVFTYTYNFLFPFCLACPFRTMLPFTTIHLFMYVQTMFTYRFSSK